MKPHSSPYNYWQMTTTHSNETFTKKGEVIVSLEVCVLWGVLYWNIHKQINVLNKKEKIKKMENVSFLIPINRSIIWSYCTWHVWGKWNVKIDPGLRHLSGRAVSTEHWKAFIQLPGILALSFNKKHFCLLCFSALHQGRH